jgi:MscS family membrane protein
LRRAGRRFERRGWESSAQILTDLIGPAELAILTFALWSAKFWLRIPPSPLLRDFLDDTIRLLYSIAGLWYALNLVGLIDVAFRRRVVHVESALDKQLGPLLRKSLRFVLAILWALFVVESIFQQNIGAWLAGLGIAGLALSLAAQDSLKNLFGSITILLDGPFQLGDEIICSGYDGTIEDIGFRSTKVRTAEGHVVTIPNSMIVNVPVENVTRRPAIRRTMSLVVPLTLPAEKVDRALQIVRNVLAEPGLCAQISPLIAGESYPPRVYLSDYSAAGATISVTYWYAPARYWDYQEHSQAVNLRIIHEFAGAGIDLTVPVTKG